MFDVIPPNLVNKKFTFDFYLHANWFVYKFEFLKILKGDLIWWGIINTNFRNRWKNNFFSENRGSSLIRAARSM